MALEDFLGGPTSGAVSSGDIAFSTIVSGYIASGQIGTVHLADESVTSDDIASGAVGSSDIAFGAVCSGHISSGQIGVNHLASGVGNFTLISGIIVSGSLGAGIVFTEHIASGAVVSDHIAATGVPNSSTYLRGDFSWSAAEPAYVAGGGAVIQATSKATGVTLNTLCGKITMSNAALAAATEVKFVVTNNTVAATDVVVVNIQSVGTAGAYFVGVAAVGAGSFTIYLGNCSAGSLSQAVVLNFAVIKAVAA